MKRLMFTLAICSLVFTSAQAQKQLGGEHNIEVNLTPSSRSFIDGTTIKYRNFIDDDAAIRFSLTVGVSSNIYAYEQAGESPELQTGGTGTYIDNPQLDYLTQSSDIGFSLGYEKHFDGTDNLSPYVGLEGSVNLGSTTHTAEYWSAGDPDDFNQAEVFVEWILQNQQKHNSYKANLFFGADYYFSDAIYIGFEAGLGIGMTTFKDHEIYTNDQSAYRLKFNLPDDATSDGPGIVDSHTGELTFNVLDDELYFEYYTNGSVLGGAVPEDVPNHVSNITFGNVFNGAIRVGFLFD